MGKRETCKLFTLSGCLTENALFRYSSGVLPAAEVRLVNDHINACELCALALEGLTLADPDSFSDDVDLINHTFSGKKEVLHELFEPQNDQRLAGDVNSGSFQFLRERLNENDEFSPKHNENIINSADQNIQATKDPQLNRKRTFWLRYRLELIAATFLLLIALGGRQVYFELKRSQNIRNEHALASKSIKPAENIVEQVTKPEIDVHSEKPAAPATVPAKAPTSNSIPDVSFELLVSDNENIADENHTEASFSETTDKARVIDTGGKEKFDTGLSGIPEPAATEYIQGIAVTTGAKKSGRRNLDAKEEEVAEAEIFTIVEESPQYPGGDESRIRFLQENIRYPHKARESSIQGTVYISFVVEKDGTITDIRVIRGIGGGCDEEAIRVIREMPRWLPGKQRGKPVRVQFNMPVKFSLAG